MTEPVSDTPRAFVIGDPIAHSRSPLIHGHWLARHAVSGSYTKILVPPAELPDFVERLRAGEFIGGNVTLPHKEAAARLCDRLTPVAQRLGAVNTLWMDDGVLWGDNTDVTGFLANLDEMVPSWTQGLSTTLILGAGGAARGIVEGLIGRGVPRILIANRTLERARALASDMAGRPTRTDIVEWAAVADRLEDVGLLVNTTSLGMARQPALELDLSKLPGSAIVTDIVYVPLETPLLAQARQRGLRTVDGLGMLLHQAVPGFARWFGVTPQVTPDLRNLIIADLERTA